MDKRRSVDGGTQEYPLPIPVQMFLWRLIRPFIRAKLGKLHEASCMFCQRAPGHHEMKEACTCLERVLVQDLHNDLTPSLSEILRNVPRWRLIQAALPYVLHATASLMHNRKDFQTLGTMETTLLYILHWILLDSAEECAENEADPSNPFFYLFPIPTMTLFIYLFAPLCNHLKDIDFKTNLRLENGLKIWSAMYECRHPDTPCFTAHCRAKPRIYWSQSFKSAKHHMLSDDVFVGGNVESPPSQSTSEQSAPPPSKSVDEDQQQGTWLSSPKDTVFPETIPEESSGAEDEHVVIFRLPSLSESERMLDGVKEVSTIFAGEASIFHVAMGRTTSSRSTIEQFTIEQVAAISGLDTCKQYHKKATKTGGMDKEKEEKISKTEKETQETSKTRGSFSVQRQSADATEHTTGSTIVDSDVRAATFLDVATLRCLFVPQWQEEGVHWALQFFYYRLRRINEETSVQQMPRRRSNSLPIPKIEVSIYQSPESKKKDVMKDFIEIPDTRDASLTAAHESESRHTRRASEKTKKRMKIADLKAFVETKLLSKSEKALEKIGQEEPKMLFEQERHTSLDTGEDHLAATRPTSASSKIFEAKDIDYMKHPTNLIKGKSMPSLSCLINELTAGGYVGDTRIERKQSQFYSQSYTVPNPIITVTEHTPTPSPDYMKRQGSIDSQLDVISVQGGRLCSERKPSLTRSQTDSNITYMSDEIPEAPGSSCYITKEGDVDLQIVLKAIHFVALRDNTSCTPRVCEIILNLIELLMDMGVMKHCLREEAIGSNAGSGTGIDNKSETGKKQDSPTELHQEHGYDSSKSNPTAHNLLMNCVIRVLRHLGCPHGCLDGVRGAQADICRSQGQTILTKLHRASSRQFSRFLRTMIREQPLTEILDFFHAYVGYCVDPSSLLSPLNQKRMSGKSPDVASQSGYATNFGAGMIGSGTGGSGVGTSGASGGNVATASGVATSYNTGGYGARGIEGQIISCVFKVLVTRLIGSTKQLKAQENISLYCDVRQLMTYVKEAHGGIFRRVALSGILDSADRPNKRCNSNMQTTRVIRHIHQSDLEEHADIGGDTCYTVDDRGTRKFLFKKRSTSSTCAAGSNLQSLLETELSEENIKISQSPLGNLRKKHHVLTPRQSERNLGILGEPSLGPRKSTRFQIGGIVNWFRKEYSRTDSTDSHESSESPTDGSFVRQPSFHYGHHRSASRSGRGVGISLQKAKRRMEDQLNKIGFGKNKKKESMEETPGNYFSRKNSMELGEVCRESEFVVLKERRLVPRFAVFEGMLRFSFLLETCQPGSVPDPHLMASLLDLPYAPVVSRACLILECAHLVHQCNKGHWPAWMKHNFPMFRPSVPINSRNASTALRRVHVLQRTAGKLFYQWAEAIGARLEEFLAEDKQTMEQVTSIVSDETKQRDLIMEDEEEDFLDDASINNYGSQCPFALRLVACVLLLEVTAFLRETYQTLPKSSKLLTKERPPPWERMYSREANRRWSVALSSMGHSQASAQSLQSIAGDREVVAERKISFVLYEPDNESEGSSKSNVTIQGEETQNIEKEKAKRVQAPQNRPFLLRRSTATTGSFKKRSLKLRRNTKEGKDTECEAYTVKRTDSIQSNSKRKVSSLSDRSDTSEPGVAGEVSGDESPGILSDDQPPESPSDSNETDETNKNFPWMKVLVQVANSFNFYCSHQNFCHPFCHRRQMRASSRLIKSVRKIYGEEFGVLNGTGLFDIDSDKKDDKKDKRSRKVSDQTSTQVSPIRRKDSVGRKYKIEKNLDGSQSGRLTQRDSSKDLAEQDSERGKESLRRTTTKYDIEQDREPPPVLKYIKTQVKDAFHAPLATLIKGAVVMTEDLFVEVLPVAWELLLESNQEVAASAAALFIVSAVRAPNQASDLMHKGLQHNNTSVRINAILRFQVLWKLRYQVWPRMEEAAHLTFKVPPPGIEFTLPSPKIGIESLPVVDPPWMPQVKTKVEEVTINQEHHRSLVTATKTRKKQQTELITRALQAQDDKKREERENFLITTIPITVQAAYEPSPVGDDHGDEGNVGDEDAAETVPRNTQTHHSQSALSLFPSSLCSAIVQIINLLDDPAVSDDGNAVYEVAYQVIWSCLVEDSALFLRYVLERLTREKQELMFKVLRHLIRFVPKLPQQAAFALYNYIIGYVMFYVRTPHEEGQKLIGTALSILWMVVHSVHGIMFKDLKQILRKEQCDASILLTANVPSAKKIIVHGPQDPDAGEIPSQFPVQEDTQFCQILRESLDFFGIEESKHHEYFLVDYKTHQIHNPSSYVRDYYFFKRSQFPQIELVHMKQEDAFNALQRQELMHKFVEIGKVLLTWAILKNVDMVVQRVVFLHEELMKLPSFPRKALEADLDLYKGGEIGRELLGLDVMHKFMWVRLIARMFEAMAGNFAYSGDIHLFLNVLNGAVIIHSEDSCILRYVVATYINAAHNFKNIFSTNGYLLIMPTLLQLYSTHQTNKLVTTTVEYAVKQFYLMNRKPFILQMFGSVSTILDTDIKSVHGEAHKVPSTCLFNLLMSLETPSPDPLNIGELVKEEKPLKAIDFCYHDENEMVDVLDCISLCVMVIAYAPDSIRGQQMLTILEAILPCYVRQIQLPTYNKEGKTEKEIINQLAIAVRTLVNNSEALTKYYNGPQKLSPEHKGSSQRNYGKGPYSPGFDFEEDTHTKYIEHSKTRNFYDRDEDFHKNEFRRPRDTLLNMVGDFVARCTVRLVELNRKSQDGKTIELLDSKCHVRLADIAHSLLKISPYDPITMACRGLKRYMNDILPSTEWAADEMRPALTLILRRLDKTFSKIHKKPSIRRNTDWAAASDLLKGVYETLSKCPYIAHFQYLKTLLTTCQALIVGDNLSEDLTSASTAALMSKLPAPLPPPHFCSTVLRLIALHVISFGEGYSLENVLGGQNMFATQTRTENALLNLLIPLFLRVGTGRKDVPKLKQSDISFALTTVLNALWPPGAKPIPLTMQRPPTDTRTGSITFTSRDPKALMKTSLTLYQVAFLALKIMTICFETELRTEWRVILRAMRLLNKRNEASTYLWNFIEFIVTHRTALYIQMLPFIVYKIGQAPISEHERNMHTIIREKINGSSTTVPKSRGTLLMDLIHELKNLKQEIENRKCDEMQPEPKRSVVDMHPITEGQPRTQRPSLLMDLLTGDLGSRAHINRTPAETPVSHSTVQSQSHSTQSNTSSTVKTMHPTQVTAPLNGTRIGGSVSSTSGGSTLREASDTVIEETCVEQPPSTTDRFQSSSTSDERNHVKLHSILPHQKAPKLRFVSSVEFRNSSGETVTGRLSPSSPTEDSSGELRTDKPRLQRSMGQSKKTFRLRKSRKSHIETTQTKLEQLDAALIEQPTSQPKATEQTSSAVDPPLSSNIPSNSSSIRSRRSQSIRKSDGDKNSNVPADQQPFHGAAYQHHHCHYFHHHVHPQVSDVSWDEDTSSTSGYRESYSMQIVSLDGTNTRPGQAPPLASPDLNDMPSTSSTTTNYIAFDGSSPDCSMNGSGGEKTALLTSSQRTTSQHSLLMVFPNQDEDTLI
ncbi:PREDICTED: protein unc-80 homolog isoform X1 [Trachymyrmex cornetzi]|uniref:protein unc-80 homolog isoform X1 n=2 Tax=Trachymyrmex cornetzi TaxID=471704 RepID=UPI00084F097D|nr:PREDICTED: protein unc-80 homolog isoform X1 [Trachymyrmex cornetzi]